MSVSLTLVCVWVLVASAVAFFPSKRHHWPHAYGLIAIGIPLLGFVTYENGPLVGLVCLIAGGSILRWPVLYAFRWMRGTSKYPSHKAPPAATEAGPPSGPVPEGGPAKPPGGSADRAADRAAE
ncbi:MAG: DUF2484 family protein [Pseudomonadota bacterium]